jgi:hypothetical protein
MKYKGCIVDIDGTIADNSHRQHYLEGGKKNWDGFFSEMHRDIPRQVVISAVHALWLQYNWVPIFVSGRGEEYRIPTRDWIDKNMPWAVLFGLLMRPKADFRPDYEIKREIYENDIAPKYDVQLVLDDRDSVVKMWRKLGLECWQVAEGNF